MCAKVDPEVKQYLRRLKYRRKMNGPPFDMRPRVKAVPNVAKILHQHSDGKRRNFFFSSKDIATSKIRNITEEPSPYWIPPDDQIHSYRKLRKECEQRQREAELALPVFKKHSHRTRQTADLLERLRVPIDEDKPTVSRPKTILDIDPEYFTIVEGRPTRVNDRRTVRDYVADVRELLRTKLQIGYNDDEALLVDEQFREEQWRLDKIMDKFQSFINVFDDFLADDHAKSMALLKKADAAASVSRELQEEINVAIRNMGLTKTEVFLMEDRWSLGKMYRSFLFKVSPMKWRLQHDFVHFGPHSLASAEGSDQNRDLESQSETETHVIQPITSLEQIITLFAQEDDEPEPLLYFEETSQLLQIFQSLASQSLASLLHIEQVRVPLEALLAGVEKTKVLVNQELESIKEQIQQLESEIKWEEKRVSEIRGQFHDIVDKIYTEIMVGSPDMLTVAVWVEDLYERCIAPNDSHLTLFQMMTYLERHLEHELIALDYLNGDEVKTARQRVYQEEERQMKEAQHAQRKIQEFDQLIRRMHRAIDPPTDYVSRKLVWRSRPPQLKKKKSEAKEELSEEEIDRITFFTDQPVIEPLTKFLKDPSVAQDTTQLFRKRIESGKGMEVVYGRRASTLNIAGTSETVGICECLMRPITEPKPIDRTVEAIDEPVLRRKRRSKMMKKETKDEEHQETPAETQQEE